MPRSLADLECGRPGVFDCDVSTGARNAGLAHGPVTGGVGTETGDGDGLVADD